MPIDPTPNAGEIMREKPVADFPQPTPPRAGADQPRQDSMSPGTLPTEAETRAFDLENSGRPR
jgi:hypothetical protein